jgi:hypothetical protein
LHLGLGKHSLDDGLEVRFGDRLQPQLCDKSKLIAFERVKARAIFLELIPVDLLATIRTATAHDILELLSTSLVESGLLEWGY